MSEEGKKKNGEYEKPESKGMGGEELEDVSGGSGDEGECTNGQSTANNCWAGRVARPGYCGGGSSASGGCAQGESPR